MIYFDIFNNVATDWSLKTTEYFVLNGLLEELKPAHVLEFGTGNSTVILSKYSVAVESYESDPEWLKRYSDIIYDYQISSKLLSNVVILPFENKFPLDIVPIRKHYDLIFVDAPWGFWECPDHPTKSRFNTMLFASEHTDKILLHDTKRDREKNTINYFKELGWKSIFFETELGLTLLYKNNL